MTGRSDADSAAGALGADAAGAGPDAAYRNSYLAAGFTLASWLTTTDHKRIGILYLVTLTILFALGALAAALMRLELVTPAGDLVGADTYNRAFSLHGIIMVWFFLVPGIPSTLGNFLVPIMIGARDLAFPRLNLASWYVFVAASVVALYSLVAGGVDTGWTFYTPYSSMFSNGHVISVVVAVFIAGFSSIFTAINIIVTVHELRAPGMTWRRLPLFVWSQYATSIIIALATPVLAVTLVLVTLERGLGIGIFDPAIGGDPLLFQHLFWFYSHPAVYIMLLPGMAVISELIASAANRRPFGYEFIAGSSIAIALLSFLVWGHHMFVSGQSMYAGLVFGLLSFAVAVPSAVKVYNWTMTLRRGCVRADTALLYALTFIWLFVFGGLTGLFLASVAIDVHVHDTYFVVAHFHYIMVGATVSAFLGGIHFWWPKITGRLYPEGWGRAGAILVFLGFNLTFFPQFVLGYLGMPRRYHSYDPEFQVWQVLSSAGSVVLALGYLIPLAYLLWSLRWGRPAGPNPWRAAGLEWMIPSPPPKHNFSRLPRVDFEAYTYPPERQGDPFADLHQEAEAERRDGEGADGVGRGGGG